MERDLRPEIAKRVTDIFRQNKLGAPNAMDNDAASQRIVSAFTKTCAETGTIGAINSKTSARLK